MPALRIEYFRTGPGHEPVREFLDTLPNLASAMCERVIGYLRSGEIDQRPRHRAYLGGGISELRVTFQGVEYRLLYTVDGGTAVLLHGFVKKTQQTPKRVLRLAKQRAAALKGGS